MASTYCSTYIPTSSANFFVKGCEPALRASGITEPYPVPVDLSNQSIYVHASFSPKQSNIKPMSSKLKALRASELALPQNL